MTEKWQTINTGVAAATYLIFFLDEAKNIIPILNFHDNAELTGKTRHKIIRRRHSTIRN
jgi:hypothetical protein